MNIKIGDILWARWLDDSPTMTELGPLIRQREVIVTDIDDEGVTVMPVESAMTTKFPYSGYECPTAKDHRDGTIIRLIPK